MGWEKLLAIPDDRSAMRNVPLCSNTFCQLHGDDAGGGGAERTNNLDSHAIVESGARCLSTYVQEGPHRI